MCMTGQGADWKNQEIVQPSEMGDRLWKVLVGTAWFEPRRKIIDQKDAQLAGSGKLGRRRSWSTTKTRQAMELKCGETGYARKVNVGLK